MFLPPPEAAQQCYTDEEVDDKFEIAGTFQSDTGPQHVKMKIPYSEGSQGYVVLIPSYASEAQISNIVSFYQVMSVCS